MSRRRFYGFTLVELLISLSLMIIVIGSLVIIFNAVTKMMTTTENTMFVFQNARAGLNNLTKDLKNTQDQREPFPQEYPLTISNPRDDTSPQVLVKFLSTTSFMNSSNDSVEPEIITAEARIIYYLEEVNNRWTLKRHIVDALAKEDGEFVPDPDPVNEPYEHTLADDIVCQFIAEENSIGNLRPSFQIDYFFSDPITGEIQVVRPALPVAFTNNINDPFTQFPFAIRINVDLTDARGRLTRTFSKVVQLLVTED
ncbi:PilW family protein [Candidatus Uabimicrobium amorphum]|uniref:Type II secretion system protein J n=1 Tax=Uabimicrobium amorphum TaxID=2596890 RepID=A0A5S9F1H2_UABAM|nr:prepilin-type N-terminal cleavage/methylation domain-containing protein [Candidatus Uabimicrobium amorphum]BBM82053.1 hypothetical protein UABAM_00396 [Candidatus Uabimicrobium amorphum]